VLVGDGGVVPVRDGAREDSRDRLRVEVQGVDAVEVEGDGDGGDVQRYLDDRIGRAGLEAVGELVGPERAIRVDEAAGARDEVLAARARAGRLVVDGDVRVGGLE